MNEEIDNLVDQFLTKDAGEAFIKAIEAKLSVGETTTKNLPVYISEKLSKLENEMALSEVHELFRKCFYKRDFVSLTLAFEPSDTFLREITEFFEENLWKKVIIDLEIDEDLIGGARVSCNDHFRDFSLLTKVEGSEQVTP